MHTCALCVYRLTLKFSSAYAYAANLNMYGMMYANVYKSNIIYSIWSLHTYRVIIILTQRYTACILYSFIDDIIISVFQRTKLTVMMLSVGLWANATHTPAVHTTYIYIYTYIYYVHDPCIQFVAYFFYSWVAVLL